MTTRITVDANEAVASVAHRSSEIVAIYPITPSSSMAELCDEWSASGRRNLWGQIPEIVEMQSEAGVAGALHGAVQAGSLATTFTASQGLLLMIPNLYKIAGELTPLVVHVAARTLATHALSIFGDHSDVMACRQTGAALLAAGSPQEAQDLAAVAHAATLETRLPFIHFFDGFRTSHQISRIERLEDSDLRALLDPAAIAAHRERALSPAHPVIRGTAQNPDVFFQAREASTPFHAAAPAIVQRVMDRLAARTGRAMRLVDYVGHPRADRVVVVMGSAGETLHEVVDWMSSQGERVGVVKVRLYRPFPVEELIAAIPESVRAIAVLDRTKESGAPGDPLFLDVLSAVAERWPMAVQPRVVAGRYGLSSKEFDPAMAKAVFDELEKPEPRRRFTIGIHDDVSGTSLAWDSGFDLSFPGRSEAVFYGLGSDGTVGANKNTIKIIGEETENDAQGYFVYDSKKSGAMTVSHLRFGPGPIRSPYLVRHASFVACHQFHFLERVDVLALAAPGATFLLNAPFPAEKVWEKLPREIQQTIIDRRLRLFAIDAERVAREAGMSGRVNTVMQTCFFAISGVLPREEAIERIKHSIEKTYAKKGAAVIAKNFEAVDLTLAALSEIPVPASVSAHQARLPVVAEEAPSFVREVTAMMMAGKGDALPVSAFLPDGTWPSGTARWEKRNLAEEIPIWDPEICIQCNKCVVVCPHAAIRAAAYPGSALAGAPAGFRSSALSVPISGATHYTLQVAPEDCTGCALCVVACPVADRTRPQHKAIDMLPQDEHRLRERAFFDFFEELPPVDRAEVKRDLRGSQFLAPLFEYSGACAGCGETPYLKLLSQLSGERLLIANATGCSSIFGGNLPTTPWTVSASGRGPAWSNSLFEDNAEFGLGMRIAVDAREAEARRLLGDIAQQVGADLAGAILSADQSTERGIADQRWRVRELRTRLAVFDSDEAKRLAGLADAFVKQSVWIVGGDGWAYDIGFGGLDHVLAGHRKINVLVLDSEVYSNTGGQQSKSTPFGASAKFATSGKESGKKDLGLMAMSYGHVYVARVALGAKDAHTVRVFEEAEAYPGPALIIAYSHCIAHGYDLSHGLDQQKLAVETGAWPLYRFDPRRAQQGEPPLKLDSARPKRSLAEFTRNENRFQQGSPDPELRRAMTERAQREVDRRWAIYEELAKIVPPAPR